MKICVTSTGNNLDSQIDPRFGRCQYFIIVESETMEYEAIQNPNIASFGGAGIQSGQLIASKGAEIVLTGNVGPNAFATLQAAGLKVFTGITGLVKDGVQKYKKGELPSVAGPTVPSHFGIQESQQPAPTVNQQQVSTEEDLEMLKQQALSLKQEIEQINKKIDEITKKRKK